MEDRMEKMEERTGKIDEKIENIQQMRMKNEGRFQKIEKIEDQTEKKVGEIDNRLIAVEQKELIAWEMDRAAFHSRLQNIEEEKGENPAEIMIEVLAGTLEIPKRKMMDEIDEMFQMYTRYAMKNKLPREVHVRFTKKAIKSEILQKARDNPLKYKGKEIIVLKQVPRKVRELKREYQFLRKILIKKGVNYRWLIPEGLMFTRQEQRQIGLNRENRIIL
uniref:L1 transposable element RRM domain-containing protein n=1 Tax=Micrurus carvalhoi TaxID=3147026 RepID=A0A2H6NA32_9SAUR